MTLFSEHFEGTANLFDALPEFVTSGYVKGLAAAVPDLWEKDDTPALQSWRHWRDVRETEDSIFWLFLNSYAQVPSPVGIELVMWANQPLVSF
jgi:hypothetical protein